jgi:hypothetical protein
MCPSMSMAFLEVLLIILAAFGLVKVYELSTHKV